jgi:cell division protein FtsW
MSASASTISAYSRSSGQSRRLVIDPWIVGTVIALLLIGLTMVASASIGIAEKESGHAFYYFERQLVYVLAGGVAALIGITVPTRIWEKYSFFLMAAAFAMLLLVLIPGLGTSVNGARRWVRLGLMNFQVSELARVMLLTYIASYAVRRADELGADLIGCMKPFAVLGAAAVLLLVEPDFGAATVLLTTGVVVLFLAGARLYHLLVPVMVGVLAMGTLAVTSPYRWRRVIGFLNPWADPFNSGFQLTQSLIAIGRGKWFGVGLGASVQKLQYLPEAHTDFVFAVYAEEFGFAGVIVVIALFSLLVGRALKIAREASVVGNLFQSYLAATIGIWLGLQSFVNIGVNMGLLPTKGLTLPLVSYGGSSMLITLGWIGVLLRIHHETQSSGRGGALPREARRT